MKKCTLLLVCKVGKNESIPKIVRENAEYDNYSCQNKRIQSDETFAVRRFDVIEKRKLGTNCRDRRLDCPFLQDG